VDTLKTAGFAQRQREREDYRDREARIFEQHPPAIADVLQDSWNQLGEWLRRLAALRFAE
jgi:hypothetical protein